MSLGVLARATKAVTAHVKELKGKSNNKVENGRSKTNDNSSSSSSSTCSPPSTDSSSCVIYDSTTNTTYVRGKILGKGGFAKCYEMIDLSTNIVYAGKIIPHSRISKGNQKQKILREVELHRDLKHRHVVGFHSYFEDNDNVYIILENCPRKSLVHVLKNRKYITEEEVRYYVKQLIEGIKYINKKNIIHRDLKLGNMLLNENMDVKIGDFGLATRVHHEGEKKMTVCGTPNYIAPEVLQKKGHSFEADVWAIGCITYALLVGRPPFETSTLKETYLRITSNTYTIPSNISLTAKRFITKCLQPQPEQRPSINEILVDEFFTSGYMPKQLSTSCCTSPPTFPKHPKRERPLSYAVPAGQCDNVNVITSALSRLKSDADPENWEFPESKGPKVKTAKSQQSFDREFSPVLAATPNKDSGFESLPYDLSNPQQQESLPNYRRAAVLLDILGACLDHMPKDVTPEMEPPASVNFNSSNIVWVTKWVDYSNKYGFGFHLSNNSIGVFFNDTSRIIIGPDNRSLQYYDITGNRSAYTTDSIPEELDKKTTLLLYFARYMDEHLIKGGNFTASWQKSIEEPWSGNLYLKKWFRTAKAIVMYLTDGTLQVNFFVDHTKIILSPNQNSYLVTYIDENRLAKTYSIVSLIKYGCHIDIAQRLEFTHAMLKNLVDIEGDNI